MAKLSQLQNQTMTKNNNRNNNGTNSSSTTGVQKVKRTRRSVPRDSPPQRSSIYRGVTRHRWTGRYEAHLWDKNCWNESQNKKGRQVYLGAYDDEEAAAHAYDLAALKYWGQDTILNFPLSTYDKELKEMEGVAREEYIGSLRRKSSGFSRGVSKYRGVARHHHNGRWEARIGRVFGNKYLYLGTYATQEEAATAYDMAAIEYRGLNAITNFDLSRYIKWLKPNSTITTDHNHISENLGLQNLNTNTDTNSSQSLINQETDKLGLGNFFHSIQQVASCNVDETLIAQQPRPSTATSALGLLLQSSKFKEMIEMTSAADHCLPPPSSPPPPPESEAPQSSFPENVQTYFDDHKCQDSSSFADGDDGIFSELNSFMQPMFPCDFDVDAYLKEGKETY
ncbi:AP2-like ethylene-responsive transcription factor At1g16060 [Morus notabilis]|uniref:AP2-like ethylene-responsive transcription factor At1g16060 n=1 Tax=Morus notabilis TaxID=981085 RepID=UPI000CED3214|nr:AP2-like ethylene-responsive transcription factor At1g16060 [Morus notabilis]